MQVISTYKPRLNTKHDSTCHETGNVYNCFHFRKVRKSDLLFGGLQVLASGCFKQLPPVPSFKDPGHYAFQSDLFKNVFPHRLHLTEVVRQNEKDLIKAVNELCDGTPSQETEDLLRSLKRPLPDYTDALYIFGTNQDCSYFNELQLDKINSPEVKYISIDDEESQIFKNCPAPRKLVLKMGCKVIITRNLHNGLVNGISAAVTALNEDSVHVQVTGDEDLPHRMHNKCFSISRYSFIQRNENNVMQGVRKQFPLKLGYAVTVDKSQGRSLKKVVVDCYNFWRPGQFEVAVGRAISKEGLQILNYNPTAASLSHGERVYKFCKQRGIPIRQDTSCCRVAIVEPCNYIQYPIPMEIDAHNSCDLEDLPDTRSNRQVKKNFPWDVRTFVRSISFNRTTPIQKEINDILHNLESAPRLKLFLQQQFAFIDKMCADYKICRKGRKCNLCFMTTHVHRYLTSQIFQNRCKKLFDVRTLQWIHSHIAADICFKILAGICSDQSKTMNNDLMRKAQDAHAPEHTVDSNVKNTLRYIAGAAINSVCKKLRGDINRTHKHSVKKEINYYSLRIMSCLRSAQGQVEKSTIEAESVMSVIKKQGSKQSLTHVEDKVLHFFEKLYLNCSKYLNKGLLAVLGSSILAQCIEYVHSDEDCITTWFELFTDIPEMCQCQDKTSTLIDDKDSENENEDEFGEDSLELQHSIVLRLYERVVTYFCRVQFADLRSQYVDKKRRKKQAHRAGLQSSTGGQFAPEDKNDKVPYPCAICGFECKSYFEKFDDQSIQCSSCKIWLHFPCVGLKGDEAEIQEGNEAEEWLCGTCAQKKSQDLLISAYEEDTGYARKRKIPQSSEANVKKKRVPLKSNAKVTMNANDPVVKPVKSARGRIIKSNSKYT